MRRPRLPFGRRRAAPSPEDASSSAGPTDATQKQATAPERAATPESPADPQERIDGLRAWLAQVDRKLGVRTYLGAAIAVLALAAATVALVLTLSLKQDAATDGDIESLRDQITDVEQSASQAAQEDVQGLDRRLTQLEADVNRLSTSQTTTRRELRVVQDDIKELRSQVSQSSSDGSSQGADATGAQGSQGSSP